ncbi:MAG: PEGA domain-containing protein [Candidatus Dadabacteria bacterium]|nr:MAG: PEGA domain-containing protein [Candidatus Dadabacteria bacterium]
MRRVFLSILVAVLAFPLGPGARAQEEAASAAEETLSSVSRYERDGGEPGVLSVLSRPEGARVFVDGEERGTTPVYVTDLSDGEHEVILYLPDQGAVRQIVEGAGGRIFVDFEAEDKVGLGLVVVTTDPPDARVDVDGKGVGLAPLEIPLAAGRHAVRAVREGYRPAEEEVRVEAGGRVEVSLRLQPEDGAILVVTSPAGGSVFLDGEPRGVADGPLRIAPVPPGTHTVRVEREGFVAWERRDVVVESARTVTVLAALVPVRTESTVRLFTDPPGARVWLDGTELGVAGEEGLGFRAPKGTHRLRLAFDPAEKPGFLPLELTVQFREDVEDYRERPFRLRPVDENYATAQTLIERGQLEEALGFLGRVPADHPSYPKARAQMAEILQQLGREREIPAVLAELVAVPAFSQNPVLNLALGYWCWEAARTAGVGEAVELLRQGAEALERAVTTPELFPPDQRDRLVLQAYYYLGVTSERLFEETGEARFIQKGAQAWQVFFARLAENPDALGGEWVGRAQRHRQHVDFLATKLGG